MLKVGGYRVIVKPALLVLFCACLTAIIVIPWLHRMPNRVASLPVHGYLHPERWKFLTRPDAETTIYDSAGKAPKALDQAHLGTYQINMQEGLTVEVRKASTLDSVYLRNGFALSQTNDESMVSQKKEVNALSLRFEARSEKAFDVLLTIREGNNLLWRQVVPVQGGWKSYEFAVPIAALSNRRSELFVFAVQLGSQTGTISLRNIALRE